MMTPPHAPDVSTLNRANVSGTVLFASLAGGFTLFVILVEWLVSYFVDAPADVFKWFVLLSAGLGFLSVGTCLTMGVLNWRALFRYGIDWKDREIAHRFPAPPTAPDLPQDPAPPKPAPDEQFAFTSGNRAEVMPKELIHGFDPRDLDYVCQMLASGFKWTEDRMERLPLPYSKQLFGKAQPGTVYTQLFNVPDGLFVRAEIITGRGGLSNRMGELAEKDAAVMMDKLRGLNG